MKRKEKPYLRVIHFMRDIISQCLRRWQGRRHHVVPGERDDIENGTDLDQEQQREMECLSSESPPMSTSKPATMSSGAEPCEGMVSPAATPIIQVVAEPGLQEQRDLDSLSRELPLSVPGTPEQSA